jgi:hypothetical protein
LVHFFANLDANGTGLFSTSGGPTNTIATSSDDFSEFHDSAVNDAGNAAFLADIDNMSGSGIFTGSNLQADKVLRTGDLLFGSLVTELEFARGFNNAGEIVFKYVLANGIEGIAVALPTIPGDYNRDAVVDAADYVVWRDLRGQAGAGLVADGNGDAAVDDLDYDVWRAHLGQSAGSASATTGGNIPEPTAVVNVAAGMIAFHFTRRRRSKNYDTKHLL